MLLVVQLQMIADEVAQSPPEVIEAPRVILRALRSSDAPALVQLFRANRGRLADSFPTAVAQLADEGRGEEYVASKAADWAAGQGRGSSIPPPGEAPGQANGRGARRRPQDRLSGGRC